MTNTRHASSASATDHQATEDEAVNPCCGGPAPAGADACCVRDAAAKAAGETGCGCGPKVAKAKSSCC